jgi:glutathione S-transferase
MIKLYQYRPSFGLPNPSPFCFKVENYLRMADIPFEVALGDPNRAPKKKLPFIDDAGTIVSDSQHILEHLKRTRGDALDAGMTDAQKAEAHVIRRTFEEGLYFCVLKIRWGTDAGFLAVEREMLRPVLPPLLRSVLPRIIRGFVMRQTNAQGTGRHSFDEVYALAKADLAALSTLLGARSFFLGDAPRSVDATAYAFLANCLWGPPDGPLKDALNGHANLVAYCERMRSRFYEGTKAS